MIDRNNLIGQGLHGRKFFYGAVSQGSVNFAESMPYLHALQWFDATFGDMLKTRGSINVHILTDSQCIAKWCEQAMDPAAPPPRKGLMVWAALREFRRLGYMCHAHWAQRLSTDFNWAADLIAGLSRRGVEQALSIIDGSTIAEKAARSLGEIQFTNPNTGAELCPYQLHPDQPPPQPCQ